MNIAPISNQNNNLNFKAKISAPPEFWQDVTHSSLSPAKIKQVKNALTTIKNHFADEVLSLSKSEEKGFLGEYDFYSAEALNAQMNVAQQKGGSWADFLIFTAKRFVGDFSELCSLVKETKSAE